MFGFGTGGQHGYAGRMTCRRLVRAFGVSALIGCLAVGSCQRLCGLHLDHQVTFGDPSKPAVPCCGGFFANDVDLSASDLQVDLSNVRTATPPAVVDAFLTSSSCTKLFDGPYPGSTPLCTIYLGPVTPGTVSPRTTVSPGTYRVFAQAYTSNPDPAAYLIDVGMWNHSCRAVPSSP